MKEHELLGAYSYFVQHKGRFLKGLKLVHYNIASNLFTIVFENADVKIRLFVSKHEVDREVERKVKTTLSEGITLHSTGETILRDKHKYNKAKQLGGLIESMMSYEDDLVTEVLDLGINWD